MENSQQQRTANLILLNAVAEKLGELREEVVFVGGSTCALFITDPAVPDVRSTLDVDCIIDVLSHSEYYQFCDRLKVKGFKECMDSGVICRWQLDEIILDVMPAKEEILGFKNRWYTAATQNAVEYLLENNLKIKILTSPHFLATKADAFNDRGNQDYLSSKDLEDILYVLDGRVEVIAEIEQNPSTDLKRFLSEFFDRIIHDDNFMDAMPGHFANYGPIANDRIRIALDKMNKIIQVK